MTCVVSRSGVPIEIAILRAHPASRVAKWWIPERWTFIPEVPKTSVGKYDKKALRGKYASGLIKEITYSNKCAKGEIRSADIIK